MLRSRCVYFLLFSIRAIRLFPLQASRKRVFFCSFSCLNIFWENRGTEKSFCENRVKKGISVLMDFCFHIDVSWTFIPRNFVLLSWGIRKKRRKSEKKILRKEKKKHFFRIHVVEGSCYIQFISFGSNSNGLISEVWRSFKFFCITIFFSAIKIVTEIIRKENN